MKNDYVKIAQRVGLLLIPFLLLLGAYTYLDPFKVVRNYESYWCTGCPAPVSIDKDYASTQTFINNSGKFNYTAFIFGNSRSMFYEIENWRKYVDTDDCFHFDASSETLLGIYRKLKFLQTRNVGIKDALFVIDAEVLGQVEQRKGHLFIEHPALSHQSWINFQFEFFKTFLSREFFFAYLDFRLSGKVKDYMVQAYLLNDLPVHYDPKYNEILFTEFEKLIETDPAAFYTANRMKVFYLRDTAQRFSPALIGDVQNRMLVEIRQMLNANKTRYRIVISPLYDQIKLNTGDLERLNQIFGKENVFDFSGVNAITADYHNYYEASHYRTPITAGILQQIYQQK